MRRIACAEEFKDAREPPFRLGDVVMLNSGGPNMLIVDIEGGLVTCAWHNRPSEVAEMSWPEVCVHRVRGAW